MGKLTKDIVNYQRNKNPMKILVACEYSGVVRDSFENAGWDAWSCDLIPTESEQTKASGKHIQVSISRILNYYAESDKEALKNNNDFYGDKENCYCAFYDKSFKLYCLPKFDLMIAHPPCTYLSFAYTGKERYSINRLQKKISAYQFFLDLWKSPIEYICIENPLGYAHTGLFPCSQIIEPYYFGDPYKKKTCLWLKNLPKLNYYEDDLFERGTVVSPTHTFISCTRKSNRQLPALLKPFSGGKEKSKFHSGIANAMSCQWTEYIAKRIKEREECKI
jgi:hypothetical protein